MSVAASSGVSSQNRGGSLIVGRAHERFLSGEGVDDSPVRPLVLESWRRSLAHGVDPAAQESPVVLQGDDLAAARSGSPIAESLPLVRSLLTESAAEIGHLVAVGDADGRLLWVEGDAGLRSRAQGMGFCEGSLWSEEAAGTNAPGTALAVDAPVQLFSSEHFVGVVQPWSCAAVPVHDPLSGTIIGVVDVTGGETAAGPQALALVRATVAAMEAELRIRALSTPGPTSRTAARTWRLEVLGRDNGVLVRDGVATRLSARHSELLLLLARNPAGLTAERLAFLLHEGDVPTVTVRAELTRLRRILGADALVSRPYRLTFALRTDIDDITETLDRGSLGQALTSYAGVLLPSSDAPAVVELRAELRARMRRAALSTVDPEAVLAFAATPEGRQDTEVLRAALRVLPARSPKRLAVAARLEVLDRLLGA